jgi:Fic-DOC domain mobile mystery protein B
MNREPEGATPLSEDEKDQLIPGHIVNREQLNEWEQRNILEAEQWAFSQRRTRILSADFVRALHRRMFDRTWKWAGSFRTTDKNIGVPAHQIPTALRNGLDDAEYWLENEIFPIPEAAVRLHHRLVSVHPFPDGNGRHARLAADALLFNLNQLRLDWGGTGIDSSGPKREAYITALKAADAGNFNPLLQFLGLV